MSDLYNKKIALAITPTDLLVLSEDLVVPSLLERFNELYDGLHLTMDDYNLHFKGLGRQKLCDKIGEVFPDRVSGRVLDVEKIYEDRDEVCMDIYARKGTKMANSAIEALTKIKKSGIDLFLISNNSVQRGTCAIKNAKDDAGNRVGLELLKLFDGCFYSAQDFQSQNPKATTGTALLALCRHEKINPQNVIVLCRASGIDAFAKAEFDKIIGSIGASKTAEADTKKLMDKGAHAVVGDLKDLPSIVNGFVREMIQPSPRDDKKQLIKAKNENTSHL